MALWGILWRQENKLEGRRQYLLYRDRMPYLASTRMEARKIINFHWAYLNYRDDLRREPHGWKMPIPVKVRLEMVEEKKP